MFENTKINEKEAGDGPFKKIKKVKMGTREKDEARIDLLRLSSLSVHGTLRSWFFLSPNGIELKISKQIKTVDWIFEIGSFPASLSLFCSFRCSCQKILKLPMTGFEPMIGETAALSTFHSHCPGLIFCFNFNNRLLQTQLWPNKTLNYSRYVQLS